MKKYLVPIMVLVALALTAPAFAVETFDGIGKTIQVSKAQSEALGIGLSSNTFSEAQQFLGNPPIFPLPIQLIQGGRVGDITDQLPNLAGMKKLRMPYVRENGERREVDPGETINPDKVKYFGGWFMDRVCLEDILIDLPAKWKKMVEKGWDPSKMRWRVLYKDKAKGIGGFVGGQAGASGQSATSTTPIAIQGSGGGGVTYSSSWADPMYWILITEVS